MSLHPHNEKFSAYLDDRLDVRRIHDVAAHLAQCDACQSEFRALESVKRALRQMPSPDAPSPQFWANAYRRLRVEVETAPMRRRTFQEAWQETWRTSERRWAGGVAVAAMLAAALAAPLVHVAPVSVNSPIAAPGADDMVDVSSLIRAHTDSAARQPLADADRQRMLSADTNDASAFDASDN